MISLFLLIFAFQNGLATEDATLREVVNGLQLTVNEMSGKMERLENEVKVRVAIVNLKNKLPYELKFPSDFTRASSGVHVLPCLSFTRHSPVEARILRQTLFYRGRLDFNRE